MNEVEKLNSEQKRIVYSYSIDQGGADKKSNGTKKCVVKRKLKFEDFKNCLEATQFENKIKHLEKN